MLYETSNSERPTAEDCVAWRDQYGHQDVITLYDPTGAATALWEENFTALNVVLDDQVIEAKLHTDQQPTIRAAIDAALQ